MNIKGYNTDLTCKTMQNAGLKQLLWELEEITDITAENVKEIIEAISRLIECYNCISGNYLKERLSAIQSSINWGLFNKYDIKALISELKVFLAQENTNNIIENNLK